MKKIKINILLAVSLVILFFTTLMPARTPEQCLQALTACNNWCRQNYGDNSAMETGCYGECQLGYFVECTL